MPDPSSLAHPSSFITPAIGAATTSSVQLGEHGAELSFSAFARSAYEMDSENQRGVTLALVSSIFIGASFIIKKKGLMAAGQTGLRASAGGHSYLLQPLWWFGMLTMIGGEFANLAAYAYAPAIVVTPLGASTIIISALLANFFLGETMHACGVFACCLTVCGSAVLVSYAPNEAPISSVEEIWQLATQPQFLIYCACVVGLALLLMYRCAPKYGRTHLLVYVLICSLIGSLSVVSCKALGIALKCARRASPHAAQAHTPQKHARPPSRLPTFPLPTPPLTTWPLGLSAFLLRLTLRGSNQLFKRETCAFACTVLACVLIQMNYLNKALDTFNTALVSSTYYVCFTTCTITASMIMSVTPDRYILTAQPLTP